MKIYPYYQRRKRSPMTLVSGNVRFRLCGYSRGSLERERQKTVGLSKSPIFSDFAGDSFGNFGDEASIIIHRYAVRRRLFSYPKMHYLANN